MVKETPTMKFIPLTLLALALAAAPPGQGRSESAAARIPGDFVLPAPGDPFEHPPFRALVLSREKPEDLIEKVAYRGTSRRYAQLRFGSPGSIRVTVVLDEVGPGDVDLFVDANRDRKIDDRDRVAGREGVLGPRAGSGGCRSTWRWSRARSTKTDPPRRGLSPGSDRADARLRRGRLPRRDGHDGRPASIRPADGRRRQRPLDRRAGPASGST